MSEEIETCICVARSLTDQIHCRMVLLNTHELDPYVADNDTKNTLDNETDDLSLQNPHFVCGEVLVIEGTAIGEGERILQIERTLMRWTGAKTR